MDQTGRETTGSPGKTFQDVAASLEAVSHELENQRKQQFTSLEAIRRRQDITNSHLGRLRQSIGCIAWLAVIVPLVFLALLVANGILEVPFLDAVADFFTGLFGKGG